MACNARTGDFGGERMNAAARLQLRQVLNGRCDAIAESWYRAIAGTSFVPFDTAIVRQCLVKLTERAISALLSDPFTPEQAQAIGVSLAELHCLEPEALGRTLEVLGDQFVECLSDEQVAALQPQLALLLGRLATGFFQQACKTVLVEQEGIRSALVSALVQAEEEARRSNEEMVRMHRLLLALSRAAEAIQRARTPQEVYQAIGDGVSDLGYHAMVLALAKDHEYMTITHMTWEPALLRVAEQLAGLSALDIRIPLASDGFFQRLIEERDPLFCRQTAELTARGMPKLGQSLLERIMAMLGMDRTIYAPLVVGGEVSGMLAFAGTDLTEMDVPAVAAFANQAAIALENAYLLEELSASRERLRQLTQQLVSAQEEERWNLSRVLHDEAGQALTALKISLELMEEDLPAACDSLRPRIADAAAVTDATMRRVRLLAQDLRPPALDAVGLSPTLEGFCRDFALRTRLLVDYTGLELPRLPDPINICLYRFLQEALTNVAKHSGARGIYVALRYDAETVSLSVEDDGRGFDVHATLSLSGGPVGIGLLGMEERLESLEGWLEIESQAGQGTRLVACVPLQEAYLEADA
jgi:signal transduction histidine kinase